jgi:SIR2-like domain
LANVVRAAVSVKKKPSPALRGLAQLNFPIIVTTNYDSLFRDALIEAGKSPITEYYIPGRPGKDIDPSDDPTSQKPFLFKIHGCESNASSMVLTDEDYIDFVLGMSEKEGMNPVPQTIFYRMSKWPTLFIGYSLQDYNLRLLLKTLRQGKDRFKTCYAIDPYPDSLITRVWDDELEYVSFVAQDLWTFVPALYKKVKGQDMPP